MHGFHIAFSWFVYVCLCLWRWSVLCCAAYAQHGLAQQAQELAEQTAPNAPRGRFASPSRSSRLQMESVNVEIDSNDVRKAAAQLNVDLSILDVADNAPQPHLQQHSNAHSNAHSNSQQPEQQQDISMEYHSSFASQDTINSSGVLQASQQSQQDQPLPPSAQESASASSSTSAAPAQRDPCSLSERELMAIRHRRSREQAAVGLF